MAEIILKIGDQINSAAPYMDGDPVEAFPDFEIFRQNAWLLCRPQDAARTSEGLIVSDSTSRWYEENTRPRMIRRIARTTFESVDLTTNAVIAINYHGPLDYVKRASKDQRYQIYGLKGSEFWFDGHRVFNNTIVDSIWTKIESLTPEIKANHGQVLASDTQKRQFLHIKTDDFDVETAESIITTIYDKTDVELSVERTAWVAGGKVGQKPIKSIVTRRKNHILWKSDLGLSGQDRANAENKNVVFDIRDRGPHAISIVKVKS